MKIRKSSQGVTLVELLVTLAILSLVLAGIYGLLNSAYQAYLNTRRRIQSQQTARVVLDYVAFRLREIEGGRAPDNPWMCTDSCHYVNLAFNNATSRIPCPKNVTIPQKTHYLDLATDLTDITKPLPDVDSNLNTVEGNIMEFTADLVPLTGFSEHFVDANGNGVWDWTKGSAATGDENENGRYDPGETELLEDLNENSKRDYFGEQWTLELRDAQEGRDFYELVETLDFSPLSEAAYNKSVYTPGSKGIAYEKEVVADGIVGFQVKKVDKFDLTTFAGKYDGTKVDTLCYGGADACHAKGQTSRGSAEHAKGETIPPIYTDDGEFNTVLFNAAHPWWNTRGFTARVTAGSKKGRATHYVTLQDFIIPRNMEVNK